MSERVSEGGSMWVGELVSECGWVRELVSERVRDLESE